MEGEGGVVAQQTGMEGHTQQMPFRESAGTLWHGPGLAASLSDLLPQ